MDIPEEFKEKIARIMVYPMRKYNPFVMGAGILTFLGLGVGTGIMGWLEGKHFEALFVAAGGIVFALMLTWLALGNRVRYEVGPGSITFVPAFAGSNAFVPVFGEPIKLYWPDVSRLEAKWYPKGGREMRLYGSEKHPIRIDNSVPQIAEIFILVQIHLRKHGKDELVDNFMQQAMEMQ
jgi:hypothetical protein